MSRCLSCLPILFGVVLAVGGCSEDAEDREPRATTTSTLTRTVKMPRRLGGATRTVQRSSNAPPQKHFHRGLARRAKSATAAPHVFRATEASLPAEVDLSEDAPEPGDQGETSSCSTWASGHSVMGWWASKEKLPGAPYAPMFLYSQIVDGNCERGTMLDDSLKILQKQGVASMDSYQPMQDELDCSRYDLDEETISNAARHKITGFSMLALDDPKRELMSALASGKPVILGVSVYPSLENATEDSFFIEPPDDGRQDESGGHAIAAFGYDADGVWILNSWTSQWGSGGWGQLSWSYITGSVGDLPNLMDAAVVNGVLKK